VSQLRSAAILTLALGALACTKVSNKNPAQPSGSGGTGIITTGTAGSIVPPPPSGMVVVEIQMPTAGIVAPAGSLVDILVNARVDQGDDFIDTTSVEAKVTAAGDTAMVDSTKLAPQGMDMYGGRISLGDRPTGDYTLTVTAVSSGGVKGEGHIDFKIDAGPLLAIRSPLPFHPYKGLLVIEVVADAAGFEPLDGPYATVANFPVQLTQVGDASNHLYRGMIDLHDPMPPMILPPLVDQQLLTVWATNGNGKRIDLHLVFVIDEEGPTITATTPRPGEIVGDIVRISATIEDPSGVLDSSVIAVVGDDTRPALFNIQLKPDGMGVYSVLFDTRKLTNCPDPPSRNDLCIVYPTISFRVSDQLGNERTIGYDFAVDNIAPVADLDPPNIRSYRIEEQRVCSWEFDPLGNDILLGDMPGDGDLVPQVFDLRARVEDDGNHAQGLKVTPVSLVDPENTSVYVLDDENQALIVDTDGDGWCDSINPLLVPTTEPPTSNNQVLKVRLVPVPRMGVGNFTPDSSLPAPPASLSAFCRRGTDAALPPLLCPGNQPSIAIGYAGNQPAIWSVENVDARWCFGKQFDTYANNIGEGWACIAVATTDFANNFSVSPPLRVDIDYKLTGNYGQNGRGTPPACTGTYDRVTKTVTNGPCKTRRFERQPNLDDYYCYRDECPGPFLPLP
jgi:hypothetical protein